MPVHGNPSACSISGPSGVQCCSSRGYGRTHGTGAPHRLWPLPLGLETPQARLWRGAGPHVAGPVLAVLRYLVEHPGRLVTKAELRQHVWAGMHVTDTVLRVCIRDIRRALDDAAAAPQVWRQWAGRGIGGWCEGEKRPPRGCSGTHCGAPARSRRPGRVVPARRHRRPPARLRQWGSGDWQDDGAGPVAGALCDGTRGVDGAGPVR